MKANELRIGNYVYDTLGKVNKIDLEAITYIVKEPHNQVKPIPLTEEWLLKFGATEKYKSVSNRWSFGVFSLDDPEDENGNLRNEFYYDSTLNVKYVHQLQNLYFALTQEELIFK
jgi:hypothetical protein